MPSRWQQIINNNIIIILYYSIKLIGGKKKFVFCFIPKWTELSVRPNIYIESFDNFVSLGNHVFVNNVVHGGGKRVCVFIWEGGGANQPVNWVTC